MTIFRKTAPYGCPSRTPAAFTRSSASRPPSCRSLYRRVWACRASLTRSGSRRHGAARGALAVGPVVFCVWLRAASVQRAPVSCVSARPSVLCYSMRRRPGGRPVSSLPGSRLRLGRSPASRHSSLPSTTLSMHFSPIVILSRFRAPLPVASRTMYPARFLCFVRRPVVSSYPPTFLFLLPAAELGGVCGAPTVACCACSSCPPAGSSCSRARLSALRAE